MCQNEFDSCVCHHPRVVVVLALLRVRQDAVRRRAGSSNHVRPCARLKALLWRRCGVCGHSSVVRGFRRGRVKAASSRVPARVQSRRRVTKHVYSWLMHGSNVGDERRLGKICVEVRRRRQPCHYTWGVCACVCVSRWMMIRRRGFGSRGTGERVYDMYAARV